MNVKLILLAVLFLASVGCVNYTALCPGDEPGQYYAIRRQQFVFFGNLHIVEFKKEKDGIWTFVRKVYPAEHVESMPVPKKTDEPKVKEGEESQPWGTNDW